MSVSQKSLILQALLARGYSQQKPRSEWSEWTTLVIDPGHSRKLALGTGKYVGTRRMVGEVVALSETGAIRLRSRGQVGQGVVMPVALRLQLVEEGRVAARTRVVKGLGI